MSRSRRGSTSLDKKETLLSLFFVVKNKTKKLIGAELSVILNFSFFPFSASFFLGGVNVYQSYVTTP